MIEEADTFLSFGWSENKFVIMVTDCNNPPKAILHRISLTDIEARTISNYFRQTELSRRPTVQTIANRPATDITRHKGRGI
jgi:hypothetical protein